MFTTATAAPATMASDAGRFAAGVPAAAIPAAGKAACSTGANSGSSILALIAEKPRYGYEIIKELGERVGGDYSPSPGVVYPTLTMLEEMGYAQASQDAQGRKLYGLTPEGEKVLADNKPQIDAIFARFGDREARFADFVSVKRAMLNLRSALQLRLRGRDASPEQIQAIVDALDAAAKAVERA